MEDAQLPLSSTSLWSTLIEYNRIREQATFQKKIKRKNKNNSVYIARSHIVSKKKHMGYVPEHLTKSVELQKLWVLDSLP